MEKFKNVVIMKNDEGDVAIIKDVKNDNSIDTRIFKDYVENDKWCYLYEFKSEYTTELGETDTVFENVEDYVTTATNNIDYYDEIKKEMEELKKMKLFDIRIEETCARVISVEAKTKEEAIHKIEQQYFDCDIILDSDDFIDKEIECIGISTEEA